MKKYAIVNMAMCRPKKCDPEKGICKAAKTCTHKIMEQESPFESPMTFYNSLCVGCGDCVAACPLKAIDINTGIVI